MYMLVHPKNINEVWHKVAPWLLLAVGESSQAWDLDNLLELAQEGSIRLWIGTDPKTNEIDLVLVTEVQVIGNHPTLVVRWLGGTNMESWLKDLPILEKFAQDHGFTQMQVWGRRGWERKLASFGYGHEFTVLNKFLKRGVN